MSGRLLASVTTAVAVAFVLAALPAAQAPSSASRNAAAGSKAWTPPRTPDGQPDLEGVWGYATITPLERPAELAGQQVFTKDEAAEYERRTNELQNRDRRDGQGTAEVQSDGRTDVARAYNEFWWDRGTKVVGTRQTSLIVDPPDGRVPSLTPEAQKREVAREEASRGRGPADSWEDRNLWERCITRNLPRLPGAYNNNIRILQGAGYVAILNEMIHETRIVPLDGRPHAPVRQWLGDSRGRWEGDTLVVDTTNFSEKTNFRGSTTGLHLIERFTRADADTLNYEVTVDDPATFTRPWTIAFPMTRSLEPIYEYACHEGNEGMVGILSGHRADEKAAEEAMKKGSGHR